MVMLILIEIWTILTSGEQWMEPVPDRDTYRGDFSSGAGVNELLAAVLTVQQEQGGEGSG